MIYESNFRFEDYPEIHTKYLELLKLRKQLMKISMGSSGNGDEVHRKIREYERGEISKLVFDTFNDKVKYVVHEAKGKQKWAKVFGDDYETLTNEQKEDLTRLLDGNFIYRLPDEYYNKKKFVMR